MSRAFAPANSRHGEPAVSGSGSSYLLRLALRLCCFPLISSGALKGVVADIAGQPRMGAVVLLFNRQDKLIRRGLTKAKAVSLSAIFCPMCIPFG